MGRRRWFAFVRRRATIRPDLGSMIIEIIVGTMILSIAIIGVMGSMGSGMSLVGESKQRSAGAAVAQERLERAHNVPYARVALYCACGAQSRPTYSSDSANPDSALTPD